jgi:short-subunit dehydrogenase
MPQRYRAILTGATGGMGEAMAQALLPHCDQLLLTGRHSTALQQLQQKLDPQRVRIAALDLASAQAPATLATLGLKMGGANLVIHNAGVSNFCAVEKQSADDIEQLLRINLLAPMLCTQALLPQLKAQPAACVVNVGSIFGYIGFPGNTAYCASKFGLRGYTQALRRELSDSTVIVKYFAPRATRTALNSNRVVALNQRLGNKEDLPAHVAAQLLEFLGHDGFEKKLGWPERFFTVLNQVLPGIPDKAIGRQLPIIREFLS